MKKIKTVALLVFATTFASSCGATGNQGENPALNAPTTITIEPSSITLEIGQEFRDVDVKFIPTTADKSLTWSSLDETVVTVNQLGDIKAIGPGSTKVVAKSKVNEDIKSELTVTVNRGPLTISEKINNSLGNIKFQGEAYKELYAEGKDEPGTTLKDTMISLFTEHSYHFELGKNFDTMDFGGQEANLWYEDNKVVQYLHNAFTNEIVKVEAKYDDGTPLSWTDFNNPMNILKDTSFKSTENELSLDVTNLTTLNKARDLVERVAFWPFEANVIENVTLKFDETRLTNISFRTTKHSDKFQDCVYGASLDVVGYGEEVLDHPKPEPLKPTEEQAKLEKALKEVDENNFVMDYQDHLMTFAAGKFYKTADTIFFKETSSDKYSRGVTKINNEVFEIGYSFELKTLGRLETPITNGDGTKATFEEVSPLFSGISSVFFNQKEGKQNSFFLEQEQLCQQFGNFISNCAGPFDLGLIMSDSTEVVLDEAGKLKAIKAVYFENPSATLTTEQIGGEVTLPINVAELPVVKEF